MFSAAVLIEFVAQNLYGKFAKTEKKSTSEATKPEVVAQTEKTSTSEAKKPEVVAVCGLRNIHFSNRITMDCTLIAPFLSILLTANCWPFAFRWLKCHLHQSSFRTGPQQPRVLCCFGREFPSQTSLDWGLPSVLLLEHGSTLLPRRRRAVPDIDPIHGNGYSYLYI